MLIFDFTKLYIIKNGYEYMQLNVIKWDFPEDIQRLFE